MEKHKRHIWIIIKEHNKTYTLYSSLVKACSSMGWTYNSVKNIKGNPKFYKGYFINRIEFNDTEFKAISDLF